MFPPPDGSAGLEKPRCENNDKLISVENDCNEYIIHYQLSIQLFNLTVTTMFQVIATSPQRRAEQ